MKELLLFVVIYTQGGQIGGTIGPLPYDLPECESRISELNAVSKLKRADLVFRCEEHKTRPKNTEIDYGIVPPMRGGRDDG